MVYSADETKQIWSAINGWSLFSMVFKAADNEEQKVKQEGKQMLSQRNICDVICSQCT